MTLKIVRHAPILSYTDFVFPSISGKTRTIEIRDMSVDNLWEILNFIYRGDFDAENADILALVKTNRLSYYFIQLSPSNFAYWKIFSSLEIKAFKCALHLRIREWLQSFAIFNVQQFETENRLDYFLITRNKINRVGIILPRMIPILLYHSK